MSVVMMQCCLHCKEELPLTSYGIDNSQKTGRMKICPNCTSIKAKEQYKRDRLKKRNPNYVPKKENSSVEDAKSLNGHRLGNTIITSNNITERECRRCGAILAIDENKNIVNDDVKKFTCKEWQSKYGFKPFITKKEKTELHAWLSYALPYGKITEEVKEIIKI